jgi:glycosyltransferase involved in cell wall biosynthesis
MKNIAFILPNLNGGGAERVALNYLRQLHKAGYPVTLIVLEKTKDLLHLIPKDVIIVDLKKRSASRSVTVLIKTLRSIRPDIVFTTHSRIAGLLAPLKPILPNFVHIARMLNMPSLERQHSVYGLLRRILYARGFKSADLVIAQTEAMKDDASEVFKLNPEKVLILSNPLDTSFIEQCLLDVTNPFSSDELAIVASGRITSQKGFDILVKALSSVIEEYPSARLYILGEDHGEKENINVLVGDLGLSEKVTFLGLQSNPYRYYKYCKLFVLSSRWEGFPNALLENFYLNTPIVATRCVPVIEELISTGVNGEVADVDDSHGLGISIRKALKLDRKDIKNADYQGGNLEKIISDVEKLICP